MSRSPAPKPKSKRALISLNLASESERVYQRIDDHNAQNPDDRVRVLETSGPTAESRQLEFVTRPFEKLVDRTVEGVVQGSGKRVGSIEGSVRSDVQREEKGNWDPVRTTRKVDNRSSASKKNRIWEIYDTSDL